MAKPPSVLPSMKTARFSKCGKPEVYLLLSQNDPAFRKAVAGNQIMMIPGEGRSSKPDYGLVGYSRGQKSVCAGARSHGDVH
jgi:hypothetical protein